MAAAYQLLAVPKQKSLKMPSEQSRGIRSLRRLYLGRLGDVLRQRQAINAQLRSVVPSVEAGRDLTAQYLTVRLIEPSAQAAGRGDCP